MENSKIELNRFFMPLPISLNLAILLSLIPYAVIYYYFSHTFLGEGFIWLPVIAQLIILRLKLVSKVHKELGVIEINENEIIFPKNLFRNLNNKILLKKDIKKIVGEFMEGKHGEHIFRVIFYDIFDKAIKVNFVQTNLLEFMDELSKKDYSLEKGNFPIITFFLSIVFIIFAITATYIYFTVFKK